MEINRDTRIIDLTVGEFEDYLQSKGLGSENKTDKPQGKFVYGLTGIMELFGCSKSKAQRLKSGKIAQACCQNGRSIVVDVEKAMQLFKS
ncbi:MAG: DUF3853 family protein [Bacteroidales bacterium]|nr:DUF3853 family protein [Bacteroidales bacterium]